MRLTTSLASTLTAGLLFVLLSFGVAWSQTATGESVLLADNFDDNATGASWTKNALVTGVVDSTISVSEVNQRIEIGPLKQDDSGAAYNGMRSTAAFNFTGSFAFAQLVARPNAADLEAYALFAAGANSNNFYRWYVDGAVVSVKWWKSVSASSAGA